MLCVRGLSTALRPLRLARGPAGPFARRTFATGPRPPSFTQTPARGLAFKPREGRAPRVKVAEKDAPRDWWQQDQAQAQGSVSTQPRTYEAQERQQRYQQAPQGSQFDAITQGVQAHLQKVYATLAAGIAVAAGASMAAIGTGLVSAIHPIVPGLLAVAPLLFLTGFTNKYTHSSGFRTLLFTAFTFLSGLALAPLLKVVVGLSPAVVPMALAATAAMFGMMTVLAMAAPRGAMLNWGVPLFGGVLVLLGLGLAGMLVPATSPWAPLLHNVMLYGGLGLFTLYVAYDTQQIVADYEAGDDDHLKHAAMLFINFQAIFSRLLVILGMRNED